MISMAKSMPYEPLLSKFRPKNMHYKFPYSCVRCFYLCFLVQFIDLSLLKTILLMLPARHRGSAEETTDDSLGRRTLSLSEG